MPQFSSDDREWVTFRQRISGREAEAARDGDQWTVKDGVVTRLMDADEFEHKYERA
jgi:hypothetical protein